MRRKTTYTSAILLVIGTLSLTGCKTDLGTGRGLYGQGAGNAIYGQIDRQFGGASYDANIGIYLAYNTTSRTSGVQSVNPNLAGPGTSPVTPVGQTGGGTPYNQIPGQNSVVSQAGTNFGAGGTQPCMVRRFDIPKGGRNFYINQFTNTGAARSIAQVACSQDSRVALSARGVYVTRSGEMGRDITYIPLSIGGGTLGRMYMNLTGTVGVIDAGDTDYVVASLAKSGNIFDTLVVMRESYQDRFGRMVPSVQYEVPLPGHNIVDLAIDEDHGMLYIATQFNGNFGKTIAYNISDSDAFAQDNLMSVIARSQSILPPNTYLGLNSQMRNPYGMGQSIYAFNDHTGNSIFITTAPPRRISNFDGLTATLTTDGRIFVIEDYYADSVPPETLKQIEEQTGAQYHEWDYLGSKSGYLWTNVQNTSSPYTQPGGHIVQRFNDVAVGNNVFYAVGDNSVNYFMGDISLILNSNVPRQRNLSMGTLRYININNQENLAMIIGDNGVKICRINAGSLDCGPSSTADLFENNAPIVDGGIMPKTFTVDPGAEEITTDKDDDKPVS
ncbi:MAG: hypothetical protein KDK51_06405 [Deltaproteobacteria bacterium]|nr:hypothetical protein [Deltaproteobacteria bacterium]